MENSSKVQEQNPHYQNVTVWCAVPTNGVVRPYYFKQETVRVVGYYQIIDYQIHWEAQSIYIILFSSRLEVLLRLRAWFGLFWMEYVRLHG